MNYTVDVVIVWAWIWWVSLWRELATSSYSVLIIDRKKWPEDVQYTTSWTFMKPGSYWISQELFHPIHTCTVRSEHAFTNIAWSASILDRKWLLHQFDSDIKHSPWDVTLLYSTRVTSVHLCEKWKVTWVECRQDWRVFIVTWSIYVDCSWASSCIAKSVNLSRKRINYALWIEVLVPLLESYQTTDLLIWSNIAWGYWRVFPKSTTEAIVWFGSFDKAMFKSLDIYLERILQHTHLKYKFWSKILERWSGVLQTWKPVRKLVKDNIVIVWDSALQANSIAGEWIRFTIEAATLLAPVIIEALEKKDMSLLIKYEKSWNKRYYRPSLRSYYLQKILVFSSYRSSLANRWVRFLWYLNDTTAQRIISWDISLLLLCKVLLLYVPYFIREMYLELSWNHAHD